LKVLTILTKKTNKNIAPERLRPGLHSKAMKILIVEDQKEVRDYITKSFRSEYFIVDSVADGLSGLKLDKINKYDL